jgi:hypothetical protein
MSQRLTNTLPRWEDSPQAAAPQTICSSIVSSLGMCSERAHMRTQPGLASVRVTHNVALRRRPRRAVPDRWTLALKICCSRRSRRSAC